VSQVPQSRHCGPTRNNSCCRFDERYQDQLYKKETWPWEEKEVAKILESLEKFNTIFILALNGETLTVICAVQESVKDVTESTKKMAMSKRHKAFSISSEYISDPSVNHNAARDKHQATTGDWLLESEIFTTCTLALNVAS
jgi:hypothetical protein